MLRPTPAYVESVANLVGSILYFFNFVYDVDNLHIKLFFRFIYFFSNGAGDGAATGFDLTRGCIQVHFGGRPLVNLFGHICSAVSGVDGRWCDKLRCVIAMQGTGI